MDVTLLVYDLSQGLARQMSMGLLGFQLDAVYHTSIEVGGREYVYDGGIVALVPPGSSHLGPPMERIALGPTRRTMDSIAAYLDSIRPQFTAEAYDLFHHNCNNFSDTFATFLVGHGIPQHIASMPQAVLASPMGRMLVPQLTQLTQGVNSGGGGGSLLGLGQSVQAAAVAAAAPAVTSSTVASSTNLHLPSFALSASKPVLYAKVPPLDKLLAKMGSAATADTPAVQALTTYLTARATTTSEALPPLPDLEELGAFVRAAVAAMPPDTLFAVVDLFRCSLADARVSGYFVAAEAGHATVHAVVAAVTECAACPYALRLVTLQAACNLFSAAAATTTTALGADASLRAQLVQLVSSSFLDDSHTSVRVAAASLLFNLALAHRGSSNGSEGLLSTEDQIELAASVVEAIGQEAASGDALRGMLLALGHLVYGAVVREGDGKGNGDGDGDGDVADLLRALDAAGTIAGKARAFPQAQGLIAEVGGELLGRGLRR